MYTTYPGRKDVAPTDLVTGRFGLAEEKTIGADLF